MAQEQNPPEHFYLDENGEPNDWYDPIVKEIMKIRDSEHAKALQQVHKFLFLANGGGAGAMLAFLGTKTAAVPGQKLALFFFCVGLVFYGIFCAWSYHYFRRAQVGWALESQNFYRNLLSWENLLENDANRGFKVGWGYFLSYCSFAFFLFGMGCGVTRLLI